jgi:hypothetical protein
MNLIYIRRRQSPFRLNVTKRNTILLKCAVIKKNEEAVNILLKHGADLNAISIELFIEFMHIICEMNNKRIVKSLIRFETDVNNFIFRDFQPIHLTV